MKAELPGAICMDCFFEGANEKKTIGQAIPPGYFCEHWQPEYWESRGFQRSWGDAAVMNWPHMEILRHEEITDEGKKVSFVILAPHAMRRPVIIFATAPGMHLNAWGSY